eukprot:ctg_1813.g500
MLGAAPSEVIRDLLQAVPGIDDAIAFTRLMQRIQALDYDVVVLDTAPTGHTLRLLSFPSLLQRGLDKLEEVRQRFSGPLSMAASLAGNMGMPGAADGARPDQELAERLRTMQQTILQVVKQFQDAERTTFICVCIAEFLSVYETERLVQDLAEYGIDTHNVHGAVARGHAAALPAPDRRVVRARLAPVCAAAGDAGSARRRGVATFRPAHFTLRIRGAAVSSIARHALPSVSSSIGGCSDQRGVRSLRHAGRGALGDGRAIGQTALAAGYGIGAPGVVLHRHTHSASERLEARLDQVVRVDAVQLLDVQRHLALPASAAKNSRTSWVS